MVKRELAAPASGLPSSLSIDGQATSIAALSFASAGGGHVIGDDVEAAHQQARRPAGADQSGAGDADGLDRGHGRLAA